MSKISHFGVDDNDRWTNRSLHPLHICAGVITAVTHLHSTYMQSRIHTEYTTHSQWHTNHNDSLKVYMYIIGPGFACLLLLPQIVTKKIGMYEGMIVCWTYHLISPGIKCTSCVKDIIS